MQLTVCSLEALRYRGLGHASPVPLRTAACVSDGTFFVLTSDANVLTMTVSDN